MTRNMFTGFGSFRPAPLQRGRKADLSEFKGQRRDFRKLAGGPGIFGSTLAILGVLIVVITSIASARLGWALLLMQDEEGYEEGCACEGYLVLLGIVLLLGVGLQIAGSSPIDWRNFWTSIVGWYLVYGGVISVSGNSPSGRFVDFHRQHLGQNALIGLIRRKWMLSGPRRWMPYSLPRVGDFGT